MILSTSSGYAYAQTNFLLPSYDDAIFVFYSDDYITRSGLEMVLGPAAEYLTSVRIYSIPASDMTYILNHLLNANVISINEAPIETPVRAPDLGDFILTYEPNPNSEYEYTAAEWLQDSQILDYEIEWLNENFRLPYDVPVVVTECGVSNAFYYLDEKKIELCYEFADHYFNMWHQFNPDDPDYAYTFAENILVEALYHELGHAVLDIHDLPFTGIEENVADQFSALILSYTYDDETGHGLGPKHDV